MTRRELYSSLPEASFSDPAVARESLKRDVLEWAKARKAEGRPLELSLFVNTPVERYEDAEEVIGSLFVGDPEANALFANRIVSVSLRPAEGQVPTHGFTFLVE
jgi:hypothetical protein